MIPHTIKMRLLHARQHAVKIIAQELHDNPPANVDELLNVLRIERESIQAAILDLQRKREESHTLSGRSFGSFHEIDDCA